MSAPESLSESPSGSPRKKPVVGSALLRRGQVRELLKKAIPSKGNKSETKLQLVSKWFNRLFPLWTILGAGLGLRHPKAFAFMTANGFTLCLAVLMLSMGITLTLGDFQRVLHRPGPVAINFIGCFFLMPTIGLVLASAFGLSPALVAGCVLIGSINGGQSSNLCTFIAKGDVALSVLMTTSTTVGTMFMTPLIAKFILGTMVPVHTWGIVVSTMQVILGPIMLGVTANTYAPLLCKSMLPVCPIIGVCCTVLLVGGSVANCGKALMSAAVQLQIPVIGLHLSGGLGGYLMCWAAGYDVTVARTTAIETAMKSSAFGFLLAALHFEDPMVKVPAAVSAVWVAVIGSCLAVYWSLVPVPESGRPLTTGDQQNLASANQSSDV